MILFRLARQPGKLVGRMLAVMRSSRLSARITCTRPGSKVVVADAWLPVTLLLGKGAVFELDGRLTINSWNGLRQPVYIRLGADSCLRVAGDFDLGPGCRLILDPGAQLHIGGRRKESASGITERSMIMVRKKLIIGTDMICAWGVFITDCDWHDLSGTPNTEETVIGDHVWIAPNCSVLKGSRIGNGCILATGAVTHRDFYPDGCLLGGIPARILAQGRVWSRDMNS